MRHESTLTTQSQYATGYGTGAGPALDLAESDSLLRRVDRARRAQGAHVDSPGWRHTLILTGRLDHHSAEELEDEIECLREEGVTALTLDLRRLDDIDSPGEQVIAMEGALFKEGGRSFAVIPGGLLGQVLVAEPDVRRAPVNGSSEGFAPRFANRHIRGDLQVRSTRMTKDLEADGLEDA
jgi:anti-anti-sigma regulatory factor